MCFTLTQHFLFSFMSIKAVSSDVTSYWLPWASLEEENPLNRLCAVRQHLFKINHQWWMFSFSSCCILRATFVSTRRLTLLPSNTCAGRCPPCWTYDNLILGTIFSLDLWHFGLLKSNIFTFVFPTSLKQWFGVFQPTRLFFCPRLDLFCCKYY